MDFSKLGQAAAETEDQSVEKKGGARPLPRAGSALFRFVEYIELGRHAPKNPQHKPSNKVVLGFELHHPDHMIETENGKIPARFTVRVNKTASMKGKFLPLFNKMNYDGKAKHMVQMLGNAFLGKLFHSKDGDKTYVNMHDTDGAWTIGAPRHEDPLSGEIRDIPVGEVKGTIKAFLWENEGVSDEDIKAMWDMIYIEGERETDDGKTVSKNWVQETIQQNLDWEGSRTQALTETIVDTSELEEPPFEVDKEAPPEY
jgi:hypothetical protein